MDFAVEVTSLCKTYLPTPKWMRLFLKSALAHPVVALGGVSISIRHGEICAIVGPNGAGKSTLFRVLTGLTTSTSGRTLVGGIDVSRHPDRVRRLIGFVPAGDQTLYLRLSCEDNLLFHGQLAGLQGHELRSRIRSTLELVGLSHAAGRAGVALSAGMRARLQLARALLHRPRVLILDEPTATVDPVGSYELLQVIQRVAQDEGAAVLLSSHRLEEIEALGRRVVLMDKGLIIHDGDLASLPLPAHQRRFNLRFTTSEYKLRAETLFSCVSHLHVVDVPDLQENELALEAADLSVGVIVAHLHESVEGLLAIEESRPPLRDVIFGILQADSARAVSPAEAPQAG